ncbi:MAG: histidinol-phosphate transaminase [Desulfobacteraceae bacterium]|jgi:histidinol-phosphate aminotransferase
MPLKIPEHINEIAPYTAGKPIAEVEREYGIKNSIKLASNENPLGPSPKAAAAIKAAVGGVHRYPDEPGYELLNRLADHLDVQPGQIIIGNGSDEILGYLARALLQPGDDVIVPWPSFSMYAIVAQSAGARQITVPLNDMGIDLDGILSKVTPDTRMVFICNPNNPTGSIVTRSEVDRFLDALAEDIVVVMDEAYIDFVRETQCADGLSYLEHDKPVVTMRTFSKAYGLAGMRVGYAAMPVAVAQVMNRVRMPFNVNSLAHAAALAALDDSKFLGQTLDLVHRSLDMLYGELDRRNIRYFPTQANFFLIDVGRDAKQVFEALLRQGVIVRCMAGHGYPNYIRINIGLPEENRKFLAALDKVLSQSSQVISGREL